MSNYTDFIKTGNAIRSGTANCFLRCSLLRIEDGTNANTLKCTLTARRDGNEISTTDNIVKDATTGHFDLDSSGVVLKILKTGLSGDALLAMGILIENRSGVDLVLDSTNSGGSLYMRVKNSTTGALQDLTTLVDTGRIYVNFLYMTDN